MWFRRKSFFKLAFCMQPSSNACSAKPRVLYLRTTLVAAGRDRCGRPPCAMPKCLSVQAPKPTVYQENAMTLCPIAVLATCAKCPAVSFCPLKTVLGDAKPEDSGTDKAKGNQPDAKS